MRWLALAALTWQGVRGLAEGITMYQPGPRLHPWFAAYHQIRVLEIALLAGLAVTLWRARKKLGWLWLAGLSVAAWECFELSYLCARLGQAAGHENILGLWAFDGPVWFIHVARAVVGVALMIGGRK